MKMKRVAVALGVTAVLAATSVSATGAQTKHHTALTHINFMLNWIPGPQHMEAFVARDKGFFAKEGLEVTIHHPSATTDAIKVIASGQDQMGMALFPDLILARAQGVPIIATAAFLDRKTDIGLMSPPDKPLKTPQSLVGKTIGLTPVPGNRARFYYMLQKAGIDKSKVHVITLQFNGPQALATNQVAAADAVDWFETGEYYDITKKWPTWLPFTKFHVPTGYFIGTVTSESYAKSHPDIVRKATHAILEAQAWSMTHPKEAEQIIRKAVTGISPAFIAQSRKVLNKLNVDADTKLHGLGWMNPKVWQSMIDFAVKTKLIAKAYPISDIETNKYLGKPVKQP